MELLDSNATASIAMRIGLLQLLGYTIQIGPGTS